MVLEPEEKATIYESDDVTWKWKRSKIIPRLSQDKHSGGAAHMIKKCLELGAEEGFLLHKDAHVVKVFKQMERSRFELQFNWRAIRTSTICTDARDVA